MTDQTLTATPAELRAAMVARLREDGYIRSAEVAAVFAKVPREHFAPGAPAEQAYSVHDVVVTKRGEDGRAVSSISAPWLQAQMIENAAIRPGDRVLEIGSGGCGAAMLAELTGPAGTVVTVDIDPWVTGRASRLLAETGYGNVRVVTGDGEHAASPYAPFDVIIVTVGAWDCPWAGLLAEGGRMVVPVIVATYTRSVTFTRHGDRWDGENPFVCGFVTLQGAGGGYEQRAHLGGQTVHLSVEGGPALDHAALDQALADARIETWTGVTIDDHVGSDTLNMHLAVSDDRAGNIWKDPDSDLVTLAYRWYTPALVEPDSFAYLTSRATSAERQSELGVHAHGPRARELAGQLTRHIREWDKGRRHQPGPGFTLYPVGTMVAAPSEGKIFTRRHVQIAVTWS
jgi:protein-L-isoaspartate(D-aspartate) O-methyltransferase